MKLAYEIYGSGKPLILLHGNNESKKIFYPLKDSLINYFELHLIDSRNHGDSSYKKEFNYDLMTDDLINYIYENNLEGCYFLGFSDGAIIGLKALLKHKNIFKKAILSGMNISYKGLINKEHRAIKKAYSKNKSPYLKLMLKEPNIKYKDLNNIDIPILLTYGQYDVVKTKHLKNINKNLKSSVLEIYNKYNHYNYIVNSSFLTNKIINFIKD